MIGLWPFFRVFTPSAFPVALYKAIANQTRPQIFLVMMLDND